MTIAAELKNIIDEHCIRKSFDEASPYFESFITRLVAYVHDDYQKSAEVLQFAISQLERVTDYSVRAMLVKAGNDLNDISSRFLAQPSASFSIANTPWDETVIKGVMRKFMMSMPPAVPMDVPDIKTAQNLTSDERRQFISYGLDSISRYGLQTSWDKNTIDFVTILMVMMYSCCKQENTLDLLFNGYYNILDRINTSNIPQLLRNFAENIIKIGYRENQRAEGYYGASRAYTGGHHAVAGLLYLNISLSYLKETATPIPQRLAFEMVWQMVKLMRETKKVSKKELVELEKMITNLHVRAYDEISFFHTVFSLRLVIGDIAVIHDVTSFLDRRREEIFGDLEHSSIPWFTLISGMHKCFPNEDFSGLSLYEKAFSQVMEDKGNQLLRDIYDDSKDMTGYLKEYLVKMADILNVEDYGKDSAMLQILAKKVIKKSANEDKPSDFLLGMRVRSDFSFVMSVSKANTPYSPVVVEDVKGDECQAPYTTEELLHNLMDAEKVDSVMWIGKDADQHYRRLTLLNKGFAFDSVSELDSVDVEKLNSDVISRQIYCNSYMPEHGPVYYKSTDELNQEGASLHQVLTQCRLSVPNVSQRLLLVKDLELSALPHQLLIDERTDRFIGELLPTANIISTELLIKTNFDNNLPNGFTKTFWSPDESGEFSFMEIKGRLDDTLVKHQFSINSQLVPDTPICSDMNIICAHGGSDISETEWFYADNKPIVQTSKVVGAGKLLVLFVCHSGSISYKDYDRSMHTIVKQYLRLGYSAVVAPMWSLATIILPAWLKTFMELMESGSYVIDAVYKANMAVKQEFVAPSAWACLHLFGNPYLKVCDKPSLTLVEKEVDTQERSRYN